MHYRSSSRKSNIFYIRLTAIITLAYMLVFEPGYFETKIWSYLFIAVYMGSNLILSFLPEWVYFTRRFFNLLVCFDTVMIAVGIFLAGQVETSFYLIYFFIIGIASLSTDFRYLMANTAMFVIIYGWIMATQGRFQGELATMYALRLPFIFVVSLLFGYIIDSLIKDMNKELRDSEEKFRTLVQSIEGYVFMVDTKGLFLSVNKALASFLRLSEEKIVGRPFTKILSGNFLEALVPRVKQVMTSEESTQFEWHEEKSGKWYLSSLHPVFDSQTQELSAVSVVSKDTTERVQAEKELLQAYEQLQRTQEQLIQKSKMETLGRLSSGIAHQLRNPLEIILIGTEFIEGGVDKLDEQMSKAVHKIKQAVSRANNIVEDFLRFSRSPNFTLSPVSICTLLEETKTLVEHKIQKQHIDFSLDCREQEFWIQGNHGALQQVFLNLFSNAIEAQGEKGRVKVTVQREKNPDTAAQGPDSSRVVVEVADNGPGIQEKDLSNIFEPFYSTKKDTQGTGLGLSIAKMIVEQHQGKIEAQSDQGQGSRFRIYLQPA